MNYIVPGLCLRQVKDQFGLAQRREMTVSLNKSRHGEPACQVDHPRLFADQLTDFRITSQGDYSPVSCRERTHSWLIAIECNDIPAAEN
jgi:hypothetical protein